MSETKFTKGEWVVTDTYSNYIYDVVRIGNFDMKVKSEANAHLIAAAPEMYEEIESDISILESQLVDAKTHGEANRLQNRIIRKVKLLAKARGEKC